MDDYTHVADMDDRRLAAVGGSVYDSLSMGSGLTINWRPFVFAACGVASLLPLYFVASLWLILVPVAFLVACAAANLGSSRSPWAFGRLEGRLGIDVCVEDALWDPRRGHVGRSLRWFPAGGFVIFVAGGVALVGAALAACVALFGVAVRGPDGPYSHGDDEFSKPDRFSIYWYADIPFTWFALCSATLGYCHSRARISGDSGYLEAWKQAADRLAPRVTPNMCSGRTPLSHTSAVRAKVVDTGIAITTCVAVPIIVNVVFESYGDLFADAAVNSSTHVPQVIIGAVAQSWSIIALLTYMRSAGALVDAAKNAISSVSSDLHRRVDSSDTLLSWWSSRDILVHQQLRSLGFMAEIPLGVGVAVPVIGMLYLLLRILALGRSANDLLLLVPTQELFFFVTVSSVVSIGLVNQFANLEQPLATHPSFLDRLATFPPADCPAPFVEACGAAAATLRSDPARLMLHGFHAAAISRALLANFVTLLALGLSSLVQ